MKILLINKFHYHRDGATKVYFETARLLKEQGHEVAFFSMHHPENIPTEWSRYFVDHIDYNEPLSYLTRIKATANILYNFQAARRLKRLIAEFQPDVAHLHVIYHQLSPSIIHTLERHGIPIVMTLHDFKQISPNYSLLKDGKIWEKSRGRKYYHCLKDRCVKDSYAKSAVCVAEAYLHDLLRSYDKVNAYLAPGDFYVQKYSEHGFRRHISVVPNPVAIPPQAENTARISLSEKYSRPYVFYYGRLSQEKGVETLVNAALLIHNDVEIVIAGKGPLEKKLKRQIEAMGLGDKVRLAGFLTWNELPEMISKAALAIVPSVCYENSPMSALEAMSLGTAVAGSDLGGLKDLIVNNETGYLFPAGDPFAMAETINYAIDHPDISAKLAESAYQKIVKRHRPEIYLENILKVYTEVTQNQPENIRQHSLAVPIQAEG